MKISQNVLLCSILTASINTLQGATDLGVLNVESSTIDDKFENKKQSTSNVFYITNKDMEKMNTTNVEDVLNTIPGITASNVGNDRVKIHVRGIDNQMYMGEKPGVAVVIDGVPVQETTGKINLDLDNIESIKVIKGSASYLYGNDAISGAIVITTKRPKAQNTSKLEAELGSFGFKKFLASTNQSFESGALQLQGTSRDTDGYWHDAYLHHRSINGKYLYYIDNKSDITFGLDYTTRKTGDGTSVSGVDAASTDPKSENEVSYAGFYDTKMTKSFLTYSNDIDDTSNFMASFSNYFDNTKSRSARDSNEEFHLKDNDEDWMQNALKTEYRKSFGTTATMFGLNLEKNKQDNFSTQRVSYDPPGPTPLTAAGTVLTDSTTDERINAFYTEIQSQVTDTIQLVGNYRYDYIKYDYNNTLDSTLNVSPSYNAHSLKIGMNYTLSDISNIYTNFSSGFRAPTAEQISSNKDLELNDGVEIPELDIEKTYNYELGIRGTIDNTNYDASIYQLDRKDYIGKRAGSYMFSVDDDEDKVIDNVGDMRSRGFELAVNSKINDIFKFNTAYTFLIAKFQDYSINPRTEDAISCNGNYVPRTSKHTLNLSMDINITPKFTFSPELIAKSSYYADEENNYKQAGYEVVNLRANYEYSNSLEIFGKITNALDKKYYQFVNVSHGNNMNDATIRVAPPRAFYAGLRYKF